jgi:Fe-Mn family superoxide dismutase
MATYTLPDLSYDYGALEPHLSGEIVELHHDKHHKTYVDGANTSIDKLAEARAAKKWDSLVGLEQTLAFNVGGHLLHSLYWSNLSPNGGGEPPVSCAPAIDDTFGGFETSAST